MKTNKDIISWFEENQKQFIDMSDKIWELAELPWREYQSSKLQADFLEKGGFQITWDIGNINTAFVAEWGDGKPVLGFAGEYDALVGLSQKNQPTKEPLLEGAPGHGCGHNLLGVGCLAAAVAVKTWLGANSTKGSVRYYGCPAEEGGSAKAFMARAGVFDDLDAAFNFHPGSVNMPTKGSCVGVNHIRFRFHGTSSHAGGSPHLGRSALDAVELMNVGVNYLREHVTSDVRLHYVITHGGDLPNVVPAQAEVWYYIRAFKPDELEEVTNRVRKIADGAALMTETTWEEIFESAASALMSNHYLADLQYRTMKEIGAIVYSDDEIVYAQEINCAYPEENIKGFFDNMETMNIPAEFKDMLEKFRDLPLIGDNFPAFDEGTVETGSTDVGDMSQITPLSMLFTTCWPIAVPGHSWGNVATGAMSIGHKGMMHAAKIMALAAIDLYRDPKHLKEIHEEFQKTAGSQPYQCPIPEHIRPPQYENPERQ